MQLIKLALLLLLCSANGCASRNSKNASTVNGALFGAAAGATIGEHNNSPLSGALIGATTCLLYTSPSPRDVEESRMPSSA